MTKGSYSSNTHTNQPLQRFISVLFQRGKRGHRSFLTPSIRPLSGVAGACPCLSSAHTSYFHFFFSLLIVYNISQPREPPAGFSFSRSSLWISRYNFYPPPLFRSGHHPIPLEKTRDRRMVNCPGTREGEQPEKRRIGTETERGKWDRSSGMERQEMTVKRWEQRGENGGGEPRIGLLTFWFDYSARTDPLFQIGPSFCSTLTLSVSISWLSTLHSLYLLFSLSVFTSPALPRLALSLLLNL